MKRILILIGTNLLLFVLFFILAFSFIFAFITIFVNFGKLSLLTGFWISLGLGIFFATLFWGYLLKCFNSTKDTKLRNLLSQNYPKLIIIYLLLIIIFISIRPEIIWSFDTLKDVISLEWTIFGISIAIFWVWNVVIVRYLDKAKPIKPEKMCTIQKLEYINKRKDFYPNASTMFNTVTLLIINLLVLAMATACALMINEEVTLFSQNFVIVAFYLCSNTLIGLLSDILKPLKEEKKAMLEETKVTSKDIKEKSEIEEKLHNASRLIKGIELLESVDEEQKKKIKTEIVVKTLEIENLIESADKNQNSE